MLNKSLIAALLLLSAVYSQAATITGRVVKVTDGDTITVLAGTTQHQVRLMGIDAPERPQPFGNRAKIALTNNVGGKTVEIEYNKRDKLQRIVGKVTYMGYDINLRQIELGMAWHYEQEELEQNVEDRSKYAQAEYISQREKVGLWSQAEPQAPWEFRKSHKSQ